MLKEICRLLNCEIFGTNMMYLNFTLWTLNRIYRKLKILDMLPVQHV